MFTNQELNVIRNACVNYLGGEDNNKVDNKLAGKIANRCEDFLMANQVEMQNFYLSVKGK